MLKPDTFVAGPRPIVWLAPLLAALWSSTAMAQPGGAELLPPPLPAETVEAVHDMVVDVRIDGNQHVSEQRIAPLILTRAGRPYDPELVEDDIRRLNKSRMFVTARPFLQRVEGGVVVIYQLVERPTIRYVKYVGATVRRRNLDKRTQLKVGDALDPYQVEEARSKLEEFYHEKGFSKVTVSVIEGNKPGDQGAVFLINEGSKQRVWHVSFVGNTIATDARLRTIVQSKPPILYLFKGAVDREKIDEDVNRLTAYYRGLGFFRARIGRELEFNEKQNWLTLKFVVDEGPRYVVRNVSVIGNQKFGQEHLLGNLKLKSGDFFNQSAMNTDVANMKDIYGEVGYIFAEVQPDPRFLEEPGQLDLVYQVEEGHRYRVGKIDVVVDGDDPRTRRNTILNRVSLQPGDIVNIKELRASERRLAASGLFLIEPQRGIQPKIVFERPSPDELERQYAERPGRTVRGQSPDGAADAWVNLGLHGQLHPDWEHVADNHSRPPGGTWFSPFTQLFTPRQLPVQHAPVAPTTVRQQSPDGNYGSATYGQVPLYHTDPTSAPAGGYRPSTGNVYDPRVTPAQYNQPFGPPPAPQYGAQPQYNGQPAPPVTTYGAAPAATPDYNNPYANALNGGYSAPPPSSFGASGQYVSGPVNPSAPQNTMPGAILNNPNPGTSGYDDPGQLRPDGGIDLFDEPTHTINPTIVVNETQTGRFMFGVGVNSDAGVVGSIVMDEQNFDWRRVPRSWQDVIDGTAWRGGGQQFRIEAVPGNEVSRYMINFREPYLFDTRVGLGLSGFFFNRFYQDWDEERLGGRVSLSYQFTPDLAGSVAFRGENVNISNPRLPSPPELAEVVGNNGLYSVAVSLAHDTRDNTFLATEGHRIELMFEQAFGDFTFPKVTLEGRQHFLMRERPDGSGRHVLSLVSQVGFTGSNTPVFERFFAGGFSTMRGFDFRGASPVKMNTIVGGDFQWLNSVEYMFPVSADDFLRGVVFCDFGTVEESITMNASNFRVAPGAGLRITVPALGPAPIALDFAVPVARADGDDIRNFSFFVGFGR